MLAFACVWNEAGLCALASRLFSALHPKSLGIVGAHFKTQREHVARGTEKIRSPLACRRADPQIS